MRLLITGGAGFVGSSLAFAFKKENPRTQVTVFDNLRRRGSELNLPAFKRAGIAFAHGDIRIAGDLEDLPGNFDIVIEASAESSVLAGLSGSPQYLTQTNLSGTLNSLEFCRKRSAGVIFLSTSRVYSLEPLKKAVLRETASRFELASDQQAAGLSNKGIAEDFPTNLPRSLYGATKLSSEIMIQDYVDSCGLKAVINRCGVISGPGQFGKVEQGVVTLWAANHYFKKPLAYTGFGAKGKQVRDLLHPLDLFALIKKQLERMDAHSGEIFNVGGGRRISTSLLELTGLCRKITGHAVPISRVPKTSPVDIPLYISNCAKVRRAFNWRPDFSVERIIQKTVQWIKDNESSLKYIFT